MIGFLADLHLAPRAWASLPGLGGDSYDSFRQAVSWFCEHHTSSDPVLAVILGGDVFDAEPTPDDVYNFLDGTSRLLKAGIPVLAIQGQHARSRTIPWTGIDPRVKHLKEGEVVRLGPFNIYGFDNLPGDEVRRALTAMPPDVNTLVLHQACKGSVPDLEERYDLDPAWVPPTTRLVLMGDIHRTWDYSRKVTAGGFTHTTDFLYSNSLCMQSVSESPDKSFVVVSNDFKFRRIPLNTRPFLSLTVLDESVLADALGQASRAPANSLVLVRYSSSIVGLEAKFKAASAHVHILFKPLPVEKVGNTIIDVDQLQAASMDSCLSQVLDRTQDPELYGFVTDLLRSQTPEQTIAKWRETTIASPKPKS